MRRGLLSRRRSIIGAAPLAVAICIASTRLIGCPALPRANYILVRRHDDGTRTPLAFGQTKDDAVTLNLAHLRHEGAKLGANEVHIHLLAETVDERSHVEDDLTAAHFHRLSANAA